MRKRTLATLFVTLALTIWTAVPVHAVAYDCGVSSWAGWTADTPGYYQVWANAQSSCTPNAPEWQEAGVQLTVSPVSSPSGQPIVAQSFGPACVFAQPCPTTTMTTPGTVRVQGGMWVFTRGAVSWVDVDGRQYNKAFNDFPWCGGQLPM